MSPHGTFLLEHARAYMQRLIEAGASADDAAKKAADHFGFKPADLR